MDRKKLIADYKRTPRPAGLWVVRNEPYGVWLVGPSPDLPAMLNRLRFQLEMDSHPDKELQADWNALGPDAFTIDVLDELERRETDTGDISDDLAVLLQVWLERLQSEGQRLYPMSLRGA